MKVILILLLHHCSIYSISGETLPQCERKFLMPMDEKNVNLIKTHISDIKYKDFDDKPEFLHIVNTGETILLKYEYGTKAPTISKGPFHNGRYRLDFMYFYWLPASDLSEDDFPVQLHIVFTNPKYLTYDEATTKDDGAIIWSLNYQIAENGSAPDMAELYKNLGNVQQPSIISTNEKLVAPSVLHMGSRHASNFYFYLGKSVYGELSCSGDVLYMDFSLPLQISPEDAKIFYNLYSEENVALISMVRNTIAPANTTVYETLNYEIAVESAASFSVSLLLNGASSILQLIVFIFYIYEIIL